MLCINWRYNVDVKDRQHRSLRLDPNQSSVHLPANQRPPRYLQFKLAISASAPARAQKTRRASSLTGPNATKSLVISREL
jgi:hypothetical protein